MTWQKHKETGANDDGENNPVFANITAREDHGYSREIVLVICLSLLTGMFVVTGIVSRTYHKRIHTLADQWSALGAKAYDSGDAAAAAIDFRNALVYSPDNAQFQFHLAQALESSGDYSEAQSYLLSLLSVSPGSGEINLALARIATHNGSMTDAMRYYSGAIYGVWEKDPLTMHWEVRYELCKYLLDENAGVQAQPELIALIEETPRGDTDRENRAGALLLRAGLWDRALADYQHVLASDRRDADALAGGGKAAFELGKYAEAIDYFDRLPSKEREEQSISTLLDTAREIQSANPFLAGLSNREKATRAAAALASAQARDVDCARQQGQVLSATTQATPLQRLYATNQQMKRDWSEASLTNHPDRIEAAMSQVFQMENTAAMDCGPPQTESDKALVLLGGSAGGASQ